MAFTAQDVKNLREATGVGMMDCKKALTESGGDFDKAVELLREKGLAAAAKKAGRIAAEGLVCALVDGSVGGLIEVNSETDFVAKNADFVAFVEACDKTVIHENPADLDALMAQKLDGGSNTVEEALREKILTIGENLKIRSEERRVGPGMRAPWRPMSTAAAASASWSGLIPTWAARPSLPPMPRTWPCRLRPSAPPT